MRVLITGSGGFVGNHLIAYLRSQGIEQYHGIIRYDETPQDSCTYNIDMADEAQLLPVLEEATPDVIFHLAAQASVARSWSDPRETLFTNIGCQLSLFLCLIRLGLRPRVLIVGSADEYGIVRPQELPISETHPLRPTSPYAVSKVAQDMLALQYYLSHGLHTVTVRPFNHIGPGQSPQFVASSFAKQIAEIEAGLREPVLLVGNLAPRRDFTDVRDVVRGYYDIMQRGVAGEAYNLGSGASIAVGDLLEQLIALSTAEIEVRVDEARLRPSENPDLVCDYSKLKKTTGWTPSYSLRQTLVDLLDYWRKQTSNGGHA